MRNIFRIFKDDIRSIVRFFFVLIIVIALGTLPSLYAWINIYANWDPYTRAGDVEVAMSSRDRGIDLNNGDHVNSAKEVMAEASHDDDIAYRLLDDPDDAIEGVRSGRFYAAIIFEDGFTYDMHHFEEAVGDRQPKITYYTNIKKNAVASKMTDAVAEDLLSDINSKYLKTMLDRYFDDGDKLLDELDTEEAVDTAIEQLTAARDAIHDYNGSITQIMTTRGDVKKSLNRAQSKLDRGRSKESNAASKAKKDLEKAKKTIGEVSTTIDTKTDKLTKLIGDLETTLKELQDPVDEKTKEKLTKTAQARADRVLTVLQEMRDILPADPRTTSGRIVADTMDLMIANVEHIKALLESDPTAAELTSDADTLKQLLNRDLTPSIDLMISDIEKALERTKPLLDSANGVLDNIDPVLGSAGSTVDSLDSTLESVQATLLPLETKLDDIIAQVEEAKDSEKAGILADFLDGDPDEYSAFFADLVEMEAHELYKPVSYGAAMTPFYTIIALWVGGVMLVTLMNCNVDRRKYPRITEAQGFFGRFLIFFLIGQIQAAVVVLGDIFLLHCSPVHPWLMWLSAAVTSMVFVALIYALTLVFGDIGRAAVVVIMMIQIAGSSGSYPIEILPDIFEKIFRFFPYPYAINAMREALCGLYGYDYVIYLLQLMVFFLCSVAIGVLIRKPFLGVKQFMYDKMKETEVM